MPLSTSCTEPVTCRSISVIIKQLVESVRETGLIIGKEVLQIVHGIMGDSESSQIREEEHLLVGLLQDLLL